MHFSIVVVEKIDIWFVFILFFGVRSLFSGFCLGCFCLGFFSCREVEFPDSLCGAYRYAFAAESAFVVVDVCQVVIDGNGLEWADLLAFAASYTSHVARFFGHTAFVFVDAAHKYSARFGTLLAQFDDVLGASFYASAASGASIFHHFGQQRIGVHVYGVESARIYAVAQSETAE